jgi:hypothetical protein
MTYNHSATHASWSVFLLQPRTLPRSGAHSSDTLYIQNVNSIFSSTSRSGILTITGA